MPHITLNSDEPGIRGLLRYRPETGCPISELAEVLLRGPSTLTRGERELIAAYVSALNECTFCYTSHAAIAACQLDDGEALVAAKRFPQARQEPLCRGLGELFGAFDSERKARNALQPKAR